MRYLPTSRLTPGMALGQDIYDGAGRLLLGRHILLTEEQISNLEFLGFPGVYVDDEFSRGIEIQQIVSPEVRRQALKIVYDLFHTDMRKQEPSEAEFKLRKTVESVVDDVICNGDIMCNIMDIKSYDDYIYYHSIHVGILSVVVGARLGLPHDELCQLAAAALLHDCLEDTDASFEEISRLFGETVANLVEGVTKLTRVQYSTMEEQQMENLRKMFMAMSKDIRVILIKISDRLHNTRTLQYQTPAKQISKSMETMEVYAPLAHRLGMQKIKWELEDLSLKYLDPIGYDEIVSKLLNSCWLFRLTVACLDFALDRFVQMIPWDQVDIVDIAVITHKVILTSEDDLIGIQGFASRRNTVRLFRYPQNHGF